MDDFFNSALVVLREAVNKNFNGDLVEAANAFNLPYVTLRSWLKGERKPTMSKLSPILNKIGAKIILPAANSSKDVCFINARVIEAGDNASLPDAKDFVAAPLVSEVGAGPGILPQDEITGWFMVERKLIAGRGLHNLIAVEIAKRSISMQPTLNPDDIVLVDRDDRDVSRSGNIMLVLDPVDGSGMIKRVSITEKKDDVQITFYSDNSSIYAPTVYSLVNDFNGDWNKAIVGRVIWAWQNVRNK